MIADIELREDSALERESNYAFSLRAPSRRRAAELLSETFVVRIEDGGDSSPAVSLPGAMFRSSRIGS